jgi:hypothetical protein
MQKGKLDLFPSRPPTPIPTLIPTPTPVSTATTLSAPEAKDADRLRKINFAYWEALNAYDPERVLAFLEDTYRAKVEDSIRMDIESMRSYGVKLGASEETPPQLISPGHAQMYVLIKDPTGTRRVQMDFLQIDDGWKISFAEEVD